LCPRYSGDREEEDVAVGARRSEADQVVAVEEAVDCRASVGVREEAPSLLEEALALPDALFEFPGVLDVLVGSRGHHPFVYRDAHPRG